MSNDPQHEHSELSAACRKAASAIAGWSRIVNAKLIERAKRNPPPAEWYESAEEECPFDTKGQE